MESKTLEETHRINEQGQAFYEKMLKDTKKSIFLTGPFAILFFSSCILLITGWTLYTWYILILPLTLATFLFYFSPIVQRGRLLNALVVNLRINLDSVEVRTWEWFFFTSKYYQINKQNITLKKNSGDISDFPVNCKISFCIRGKKHQVYLIKDFFDNWNEIILKLKIENTIKK